MPRILVAVCVLLAATSALAKEKYPSSDTIEFDGGVAFPAKPTKGSHAFCADISAVPSTPTAGQQVMYCKAGAGWCAKDSTGTERCTGSGGGGGISDGDKGDITVSGGGATWTVDSGAVAVNELGSGTSADLAGVISNETGSGALVFGAAPNLSAVTFTGANVVSGSGNLLSPVNGGEIVPQNFQQDSSNALWTAGNDSRNQLVFAYLRGATVSSSGMTTGGILTGAFDGQGNSGPNVTVVTPATDTWTMTIDTGSDAVALPGTSIFSSSSAWFTSVVFRSAPYPQSITVEGRYVDGSNGSSCATSTWNTVASTTTNADLSYVSAVTLPSIAAPWSICGLRWTLTNWTSAATTYLIELGWHHKSDDSHTLYLTRDGDSRFPMVSDLLMDNGQGVRLYEPTASGTNYVEHAALQGRADNIQIDWSTIAPATCVGAGGRLTFTGGGPYVVTCSVLADADIPDTITASNYLPLAGGTLTGDLVLSGDANEGVSGGGLTDCDASNQTLQWDSTTNKFSCGTDDTGGGGANSFETQNTPAGTDPVADSATDTLNWAASGIVTITGDSSTDTITIGATEVDGSTSNEIEVVDEAYSAANFNGGTTTAVSQDDLYDQLHIGDADDDGLIDRFDDFSSGPAAGLTLYGGSNANAPLTLEASSNADKGYMRFIADLFEFYGNGGTSARLNLLDDDSSNYIQLRPPAAASGNYVVSFPDAAGTLALTTTAPAAADITGSLATGYTVGTNAVTLGTDTTGNYVSDVTANQGLLLTGTEGATVGLIACTTGQILKRQAGSTWACAADTSGIIDFSFFDDDGTPEYVMTDGEYLDVLGGVGVGSVLTTGTGFGRYTLTWLPGEVDDHTFGTGADASLTQTFNPTGTSNPTWTYSDGVANLSTGALQVGGVAASLTGHTHDSTTISGLDISADTNLAATAPLALSGDAVTTSMATSRLLGRITAGTGVAEELTGTQATTLLDAFTSGLKGLAPASGGGTTNFLRADGSWAAPPGGGGPLIDICATAVCNGSTDDQSVIQGLIDANTTNGATLFMSNGKTAALATSLTPKSNVRIACWGGSGFVASGSIANAMLRVTGSADNWSITGCELDLASKSGVGAIYVEDGSNYQITENRVFGVGTGSASAYSLIRADCTANDCVVATNKITGSATAATNDTAITTTGGVVAWNTIASPGHDGIALLGSKGRAHQNTISGLTGAGIGIDMESTGGSVTANAITSGASTGTGIAVLGGADDLVVAGNSITSSPDDTLARGISLGTDATATSGLSFDNNVIKRVSEAAFYLLMWTNNGVSITANKVFLTRAVPTATLKPVHVFNSGLFGQGLTVSNNYFEGGWRGADSDPARDGLFNTNWQGNRFYGLTGAMAWLAAPGSAGIQFAGNYYNTDGSGGRSGRCDWSCAGGSPVTRGRFCTQDTDCTAGGNTCNGSVQKCQPEPVIGAIGQQHAGYVGNIMYGINTGVKQCTGGSSPVGQPCAVAAANGTCAGLATCSGTPATCQTGAEAGKLCCQTSAGATCDFRQQTPFLLAQDAGAATDYSEMVIEANQIFNAGSNNVGIDFQGSAALGNLTWTGNTIVGNLFRANSTTNTTAIRFPTSAGATTKDFTISGNTFTGWGTDIGNFKATYAQASFPSSFVAKPSDQSTITSTSFIDVTALSMSIAASRTYRVYCHLIWTATATGEGIGFSLNGPASPALVSGRSTVCNSACTSGSPGTANYVEHHFNAYDSSGATSPFSTSSVAGVNNGAVLEAIVTNGTTAGSLTPRVRAETGSGQSVTVKAGSYCEVQQVPQGS